MEPIVRNWSSISSVLLLLWSSVLFGQSWPQTVEVFINGTPQIVRDVKWAERNGCEVQLRDVEAIFKLEDQLTQRITDDVATTTQFVEKHFAKMELETQQRVIAAGIHRAAAQAYGVRVYPTIMIDRRYRFENEADIRRAVHLWRGFTKDGMR